MGLCKIRITAARLDILKAMEKGDFYSSTGVEPPDIFTGFKRKYSFES